jgi:HEAT repeat protein
MSMIRKPPAADTIERDQRLVPRDSDSLVEQLEHADAKARRWAARDLAACQGVSAALLSRLRREAEPSVREVLFSTLTCLGDPVAVAGLVECLRSEDAALRNEAIECLKQLPDEVAPLMNGLLADADPDVRIFAVNVLESLRHPSVEAWLLEVIERDPAVNVCATAVDLLVEVGSGQAREPLQHLKARWPNEPYIWFAADLALKRIARD